MATSHKSKIGTRAVGLVAAAVVVLLVLGIVLIACLTPRVNPKVWANQTRALTTSNFIPGTRIPKVIWTYWNSSIISPFLQKCINSWRKYHPDYQVIVLEPTTLELYVDPGITRVPWNDNPTREADIIRANILALHGGVWSDMSIMLFGPCPQLLNAPVGTEFIGFYLDGFTSNPKSPVLENWWFATAPGAKFIVQWRDAFMNLYSTMSIAERVRRIEVDDGVDLQKIHASMKQYLSCTLQRNT